MATKKTNRPEKAKQRKALAEAEKPIALTLKIDSKTYMRLSTMRARERRTAQDILTDALKAYLDRA